MPTAPAVGHHLFDTTENRNCPPLRSAVAWVSAISSAEQQQQQRTPEPSVSKLVAPQACSSALRSAAPTMPHSPIKGDSRPNLPQQPAAPGRGMTKPPAAQPLTHGGERWFMKKRSPCAHKKQKKKTATGRCVRWRAHRLCSAHRPRLRLSARAHVRPLDGAHASESAVRVHVRVHLVGCEDRPAPS